MTNEIIKEMVTEINGWITLAKYEYDEQGFTTWYQRTTDRINGMCRMLNIATGKSVTWDRNGVTIKE